MKTKGKIRLVGLKSDRIVARDDEKAFLSLHKLKVQNVYVSGASSPEYNYEGVTRKWLDAVVLVLTADIEGKLCVCLRACIRPPLLLRPAAMRFKDNEDIDCVLWELPAGLIEDGENSSFGIKRRASAEAVEETGYEISPDKFQLMDGAPFLSPGVMPERIFYAVARVDDIKKRVTPSGDGSHAEDDAGLWWIPVEQALDMCNRNEIKDAKTELGLYRITAFKQGLV